VLSRIVAWFENVLGSGLGFRVLQTDQVDVWLKAVQLKAVQLLGWFFALPGWHVAQEYWLLFSEFLKRIGDKSVVICIAGVRCAKLCTEANPSGLEVSEILAVCSYLTSFHSSWVYFKRVEWHCQVWGTSYGHSLCSL
jgi:uncharacterized membrane protein